jgi:excisionase family DNA binding protein
MSNEVRDTAKAITMTNSRRLCYADAASYLGLKVGTLRSMVHRRQVPHIRMSPKLVVFDLAALDEWLRKRSVPVND